MLPQKVGMLQKEFATVLITLLNLHEIPQGIILKLTVVLLRCSAVMAAALICSATSSKIVVLLICQPSVIQRFGCGVTVLLVNPVNVSECFLREVNVERANVLLRVKEVVKHSCVLAC